MGNSVRILHWTLSFTILVITSGACGEATALESCSARVSITLPDTSVYSNSDLTIPIRIDNPLDTIVGFAVWIGLDRPADIMAFLTDSLWSFDTTYWKCTNYSGPNCVDSIPVPADSPWTTIHIDTFNVMEGNIDTSGTLIAGWEYVQSRTFSGTGIDLLIVGIANLPGGPLTRGFAPQFGGTLVKMLADVFEDNDPFTDSTVVMTINAETGPNLGVVTQDPYWSIWKKVPYWDSLCWVCSNWNIDSTANPPETTSCNSWYLSDVPPCDSITVQLDSMLVLDSTKLCLTNGSVKILPPPQFICGDLNGDSAQANVLDLNFQVNRIFRNGPLPFYPEAADVNCDGANGNILDLNAIINRIFRNGPALCNGGWCP
ncbi:MAG TPA: hypothetical protein VHP63_07540 [candidate division Zixibacteria bacterium]|nr:hypothetical protein [candidate division Zixibacteria bacterium]